MDLYDFLMQKNEQKQNTFIEEYTAKGEADDLGIPTGLDDETMQADDSVGDQDSDDFGGGFDDGFGDETEGDTNEIMNPLADIDDSELSLVTELRNNFTILYNDNKSRYEKLLSKNLDSSEFGPQFKEIQDQYKDVLTDIRLYLKNKYDNELLATKILQFNKFKAIINTLTESANQLLTKIGVKDRDENDL